MNRADSMPWVREAVQFLAETCGAATCGVRITVSYTDGSGWVEMNLPSALPPPKQLSVPKGEVLRQVHHRILSAATPNPTKARTLAHRAGFKLTNYFRDALRMLVRMELLRQGPDGYYQPAKSAASGAPPERNGVLNHDGNEK